MLSTMQDYPLTINHIFEHGASYFFDSEVVTCEEGEPTHATFGEVAGRTLQLASALQRLGVEPGDRVATFGWNNQEHVEAYYAIPCMGAVMHTLNIRLFPEQLVYIANHAEDKIIIVDDVLVPLLAKIAPELKTVEHFIVTGDGPAEGLGDNVLRYEELLAAEEPIFEWPELDERSAAAMCYTSGTTGNPKGVVYSHRSTYLHSLSAIAGLGINENDRMLPVVPMFHANAWGIPYAAWFMGADLVLPDRFLIGEPLARFIEAEKPTIAGAVPTVWNELLRFGESNPIDLSSIRLVMCGGAAVPLPLMQRFEKEHGMRIIQGWGMTETGPVAALAFPPKATPESEEWQWRDKTGRAIQGVEIRLCGEDGQNLPWDGETVGEIEIRGPYVTASYYRDEAPEKFHDGWLRTGDVGCINEKGFIKITDRSKDVIKSGGEWISSVELEGLLLGHASVAEAAVIGVPDEKWDERPLACVVLKEGTEASPDELRDFLADKVAKWWLPERWAFIDEVPKTSTGKFDKKVLRSRHGEGEIKVVELS